MAFIDPNKPIVARQIGTNVSPFKRIEINSTPGNTIDFWAGIPESTVPGGIQVDGQGPGTGAISWLRMFPPQITGSTNNSTMIEMVNGGPSAGTGLQPGIKLKAPYITMETPGSGTPVRFNPAADGSNVNLPFSQLDIKNLPAVVTTNTTLNIQSGEGTFTVGAAGDIFIPIDPNLGGGLATSPDVVPSQAFITFQNSQLVGTADLNTSTFASGVRVFVRNITAAGALSAAGTVVVCRYMFLAPTL